MLQINMADVMNVIGSLTPYLIAIGVLFALALIITFAVNKKTVKEVATRKIVHSESWLVALVGIVVAVSMMLTGPLSTLLNNATTTKYMLSDTTVSKANELAKEVQSEAITMLKNDDSNLPLSNKKVNVFGWGSTNPVYGGTGSGSMSDQYETVSMLDGMKQAGIETNSELTKLYTDYRKDRPVVAMWSQDWTLPEVPAKQYSDKLISDAKDFSDEAVITITRVGGEGADLPTKGHHLQQQFQGLRRFQGWRALPAAVPDRARHDRPGHQELQEGDARLQRRQRVPVRLPVPVSADQVRAVVPAGRPDRLLRTG